MAGKKFYLIFLLAVLILLATVWFFTAANFSTRETDSVESSKLGQYLKAALSSGKRENTPFVKFRPDGSVQVYVTLSNIEQPILDELRTTGLEIEVVRAELKKVQGWASQETVDTLISNHNVLKITAPSYSSQVPIR